MIRRVGLVLLGIACLVSLLTAQEKQIQRGVVKKVDLSRGVITITVRGKDQEYRVTEKTRLVGTGKEGIKEGDIREGAEVQFLAADRGGTNTLIGLRVHGKGDAPAKGQPDGIRQAQFTKVDTRALKPLPELGKGKYRGFSGGLYPEGRNERPAAHETLGLSLARKVQPLDTEGKPTADGKVVLLSVGMSNTTQEFSTFKQRADADRDRNPRLVIVDGAQGGMSANRIVDPSRGPGKQFWTTVDQRLRAAGATPAQVQVAWIKQADPGPDQGFPRYAKTLQAELARIIGVMHERFPNLKLVYLSSRTYGGYARSRLNPEPYAYESGLSVKWLIEQQIKGDPALNADPSNGKVRAPWLSWGPYLWANGTKKNADGLFYQESDFGADGTHPSASGRRKVAEQLLRFFKSDPTARPWFVKPR